MPGNLNTYNDIELIEALRSSKKSVSEAAFKVIYERWSALVFNYCRKILGEDADIDDIFQEVFLNFIDFVNKKEPINFIKGFLVKISRNICINYIKHIKLTPDIQDFYDYTVQPQSYGDIELTDILRKAIDLLDDHYKEALILRIYEGFSYDEMIAITGETHSVLKNRIWRAKEKITSILQPFIDDLNKENEINRDNDLNNANKENNNL
jgi:RNA polymerase sigma-70 factor (ECF subfamily)